MADEFRLTPPPDPYICPYDNAVRNEKGELVPCGIDSNFCGDCANDAFEEYRTNTQNF